MEDNEGLSRRPLMCYPRMTVTESVRTWESNVARSIEELGDMATDLDQGLTFYPLAQRRAAVDDLRRLRGQLLSVAVECGFPGPVSDRRLIRFDQIAGSRLLLTMEILPSDAGSQEVWNFINARLVPDVVLWRYGKFDTASKRWNISPDRLYGMTRTAIGRLWWRAYSLGSISESLGEDEAVQLTERTSVGGYMPLSRAIGRKHLKHSAENPQVKRMMMLRDVCKRLVRKMAVQSVHVMTAEDLDQFVEILFQEATLALTEN